jgi:hypothetical protein
MTNNPRPVISVTIDELWEAAEDVSRRHGIDVDTFLTLGPRDELDHHELRDAWLMFGDILHHERQQQTR